MKNLLLSSSIGYGWDKLEVWNESAKKTGNEVTNILINYDESSLRDIKNKNVNIVEYNIQSNKPPHNLRFIIQYKYLMSIADKYDRVILTDSRDVYFHSDPFPKLEELMQKTGKSIVCGSESILYKNEVWGNGNLKQGFDYVYDEYKNNEICNVGVLCGQPKAVAELCLLIFTMCFHNPAYVSDQSSFNIIMGTEFGKKMIHMSTPSEGLMVHMGTVSADKFQEFIIDKTNNLKGQLPSIDGNIFPIIHQYDRFPETWSLLT
jgi:hypothetical protein